MNSIASKLRRIERGLRFFEAGSGLPPGLTVASGRLGLVEGPAAVRQSLVTLLLTRPGERVMRPDYGCDLDALAFAPMGPTTFMLARLVVNRAIERFEKRVRVDRITAEAMPQTPERLLVTIGYTLRRDGSQDSLALEVPTRPDAPPDDSEAAP